MKTTTALYELDVDERIALSKTKGNLADVMSEKNYVLGHGSEAWNLWDNYIMPMEYGDSPKTNAYLSSLSYRENFQIRQLFTTRYCMWAFVTPYFVDNMVKSFHELVGKNAKVLEVASGGGWLYQMLKERGVNIKGTDDRSTHGYVRKARTRLTSNMDAVSFLQKNHNKFDALIMSWPPHRDPWPEKVVKIWGSNPNRPIYFIGEGPGGCTATVEFFNGYDDESFNGVREIGYVAGLERWDGMHDNCTIYVPNL